MNILLNPGKDAGLYLKKKMNLPQPFLRNICILTNKFNVSGVSLFLMKSTFTMVIQIKKTEN